MLAAYVRRVSRGRGWKEKISQYQPFQHGLRNRAGDVFGRANPLVLLPLDTVTRTQHAEYQRGVGRMAEPTRRPWNMKRTLNILSNVWATLRTLSMLKSAWEFIRDHHDDLL